MGNFEAVFISGNVNDGIIPNPQPASKNGTDTYSTTMAYPTVVGGYLIWKCYYGGLAMRVQSSNTQEQKVGYLLTDHLGSIYKVVSQSDGGRKLENRYSVWGITTNIFSDPLFSTDKTYTGQDASANSGLIFYQSRWYDPCIMRWLQPDTVIPDPYNPLDYDRYSYVRNNPINLNDPSGHSINLPTCPSGYCNSTWVDFSGWHPIFQTFFEAIIAAPICFYILGCNIDMVNRKIDGPTTSQYQEARKNNVVAFGIDIQLSGIDKFGGQWVLRNESMSEESRFYQQFISGRSDKAVYKLGGYTFDGFDQATGTLLDGKNIPLSLIDKGTGEFKPWVGGTTEWIDQATNQIKAAGNLKIKWFFSSQEARDAMYNLFSKSNPDLLIIDLIYKSLSE